MLGKIFGVICTISFVFALFCGNMAELAGAVIDGAAEAVQITLSLLGMMALWCGVMRVAQRAGAVRVLSRLISPFLRIFFPTAYRTGRGVDEITASVGANLLGIGNAATPLAIAAMEKMQEDNPNKSVASDDMITLSLFNSSAPNLLPTTLIALRRAAGSVLPYGIIVPVWICSFACAFFALVLSRAFALASRAVRGK